MIPQTTLPGTTLRLSRLAFGTGSLHHLFSGREREALLCTALEHGITHFDTSPYYGYGLAEESLGAFLRGRVTTVSVASKLGLYPPNFRLPGTLGIWGTKALGRVLPGLSRPIINWSLKAATKSLSLSLKRLGRDYLDILFLHEPNPQLICADEFLAWLDDQRRLGKVRNFGLAGPLAPMLPWVESGSRLSAILQVKDSQNEHEADALLKRGRELQLTYGYLSRFTCAPGKGDAVSVLREALARNRAGSIVFSTRQIDHLRALASALGGKAL